MLGTTKSNYYDILNVPRDASKSQIREAYIRMRNTFSGQNQALYSLFDETEAQAMLERVEEAFRALNDDQIRLQYDRQGPIVAPESHGHAQEVTDAFRGTGANTYGVVPKTHQATKAMQATAQDIQVKVAKLIEEGDLSDGTLYRKIRETVGVSEDEMQSRTKIGVDHIRGIETNTFDRLPRPIFVKGFLRSYFRYLGVNNSDELVAAFSEKYQDFLDKRGLS